MSKKTLAMIVGILAVLVVGGGSAIVSVFTGHDSAESSQPTKTVTAAAPRPAAASSSSTVPGAGGPTSLPAPPEATPSDMSVKPAPSPAESVATQAKKFVTALVHTKGVSRSAWSKKIYTFTATKDVGDQITFTDPATLPVQHVTGNAKLVSTAKTEAASTYFVPTSGPGFTVTLDTSKKPAKVLSVQMGKQAAASSTAIDPE